MIDYENPPASLDHAMLWLSRHNGNVKYATRTVVVETGNGPAEVTATCAVVDAAIDGRHYTAIHPCGYGHDPRGAVARAVQKIFAQAFPQTD